MRPVAHTPGWRRDCSERYDDAISLPVMRRVQKGGGAMSRFIQLSAGLACLWLAGGAPVAAQEQADPDSGAALRTFNERVGEYAALHQRLEASLPPLGPTTSLRSAMLSRLYLAAAIKAARPHATSGNIFTPPVAQYFRSRVALALEGRDVDALLRDLFEEHASGRRYVPHVHDSYPEWATHETPTILLHALPRLPEDVEYHLIGRDLILWDSHADLIVDVLADVLPTGSATRTSRDGPDSRSRHHWC
jgi:hypothetical protein